MRSPPATTASATFASTFALSTRSCARLIRIWAIAAAAAPASFVSVKALAASDASCEASAAIASNLFRSFIVFLIS